MDLAEAVKELSKMHPDDPHMQLLCELAVNAERTTELIIKLQARISKLENVARGYSAL